LDALSELAAEAAGYSRLVAGHLLRWALRWGLGFALVAWITRRWEGLGWLWWAAGATAALSLLATLGMAWSVRRQVAEVGSMLLDLELERLAGEALADESEAGERTNAEAGERAGEGTEQGVDGGRDVRLLGGGERTAEPPSSRE
jgi:hypothetical protein